MPMWRDCLVLEALALDQLQQSTPWNLEPVVVVVMVGGGAAKVSKQLPAVACTFSYWLSLCPLPLCGCQVLLQRCERHARPLLFAHGLSLPPPTHQQEVSICFSWRCFDSQTPVLLHGGLEKLLESGALHGRVTRRRVKNWNWLLAAAVLLAAGNEDADVWKRCFHPSGQDHFMQLRAK